MENKNKGYIDQAPSIFDYVQGLETGIIYEVINQSGIWEQDHPSIERQYNRKGDYLACSTFAALNAIETRLNFKIRNNLIAPEFLEFLKANRFIDAEGKVNFSDRFIAKLSGTDIKKGNNFKDVADTIRKFGLVAEQDWPTNQDLTWDEYYANIPATTVAQAQNILKYIDFGYEYVDVNTVAEKIGEETLKALKQSPLQIAIPIPGGHATMLSTADETGKGKYFDSYEPFLSEFAPEMPIHYTFKLIDIPKKVTQVEKPEYTFFVNLQYGSRGKDVQALQKILKYEGDFELAATTEFYGRYTEGALARFQKRHGLLADGKCGPKTRAVLNDKYAPKKKS